MKRIANNISPEMQRLYFCRGEVTLIARSRSFRLLNFLDPIQQKYNHSFKRNFSSQNGLDERKSSNIRPESATPLSTIAAMRRNFLIYGSLSKFRLSSLVVFTSGAGYAAAMPLLATFDPTGMAAACVGTGLCAASASTFNQVLERDRDALMKRTQQRPLPCGQVTPFAATAFGCTTGIAGLTMLLVGANPTTAALGLFNIGLYAGLYTYSKQHTELNTWVGSVVGAVPPLMGWAAATGGDLTSLTSLPPLSLSLLLFLWQFPHFFALSWLYREDYSRGGFQMVSGNDPDGIRTSELILEYSAYLAALPIVTTTLGMTSYMFALEGTAANAYLIFLGSKFYRDRTNANARKIFLASLWYLPVLLSGFLIHSKLQGSEDVNLSPEEGNSATKMLAAVKDSMKEICLHEMIASNSDKSVQQPQMCAKVAVDKAVKSTSEELEATVSEIADKKKSQQENLAKIQSSGPEN